MEHRVDSVLHPSGRTFYLSSLASGMKVLSGELNLFLIGFLVTHMFPFFLCAPLAHVFSIERYEKSPSRRARELLCLFRRYDSITLLQRVHPRF